jgi:CheY-like chemotaxis protein
MKVVLIDDDRDDAQIMRGALEELDKTVDFIHFGDPQDGLDFFLAGNEADQLFLDINMPVMSGWQVLKKLRQELELHDLPIIVYTTSAHDREKQIAMDLGANAFLTKPDDYFQLKKQIKSMVLKKL